MTRSGDISNVMAHPKGMEPPFLQKKKRIPTIAPRYASKRASTNRCPSEFQLITHHSRIHQNAGPSAGAVLRCGGCLLTLIPGRREPTGVWPRRSIKIQSRNNGRVSIGSGDRDHHARRVTVTDIEDI